MTEKKCRYSFFLSCCFDAGAFVAMAVGHALYFPGSEVFSWMIFAHYYSDRNMLLLKSNKLGRYMMDFLNDARIPESRGSSIVLLQVFLFLARDEIV